MEHGDVTYVNPLHSPEGDAAVADAIALRKIGFAFTMVTATVAFIAATLVLNVAP